MALFFPTYYSISEIGMHPHIDDVLDLMKYSNLLLTYFSSLILVWTVFSLYSGISSDIRSPGKSEWCKNNI